MQRRGLVPFVLPLLFFSMYFPLSLLRLWAGNASIYDLGIVENLVWRLMHGDFSALLVGHFRPGLLVYLPLYCLIPRTESILFINTLGVAFGGLALWPLARERFGPKGAMVIQLAYFLHPFTGGLTLFDAHPETWFPPLAFLGFWALSRNRDLWAALALLAGALVKDFLGLTVGVLGLYLIYKRKIKLGLALALGGFGAFAVGYFFSTGYGFYSTMFGGPEITYKKLNFIFLSFFNLLGIPLLSGLSLPGLLHPLGTLFAKHPGYWSRFSQYGASILPYMFASACLWRPGRRFRRLVSLRGLGWLRALSEPKLAVKGILAATLLAHLFAGFSPLSLEYHRRRGPATRWIFRVTPEARERFALLWRVPDGSLSAHNNLVGGRVAKRWELLAFPYGLGRVEWVLAWPRGSRVVGYRWDPEEYRRKLDSLEALYFPVDSGGGAYLYSLKGGEGASP